MRANNDIKRDVEAEFKFVCIQGNSNRRYQLSKRRTPMASKLRFSLSACLLPIVLSAAITVHAADASPAQQPSCQTTILFPNNDDVNSGFGESVAVNGQTALVGVPYFFSPNPPYTSGRVAVFSCDASTQTWVRTGTIEAPPADAGQEYSFGTSTALQGDVAVIGADYAIYVYKRQGQSWNQLAKILPKNSQVGIIGTPAEQWGSVVAFSEHVLAVGVTEITSTPAPSGDGVLISNSYYVDVYQIVTHGDHGAAIRIAQLKPPAGDTGTFGAALALDRDSLVVGDPPDTTAYVYKRHNYKGHKFTFPLDQKLTPAEATTSSNFGMSAAISKGVILIGAPAENTIFETFEIYSGGAMYAFRHKSGPDSPWLETQHFSPATLGYGHYASFGGSVAVNSNGQAVIGTPKAYDFSTQTDYGPTFLYTLEGDQFVMTSNTSSGFIASTPSTSLGITDEYLITGRLVFQYDFYYSSAEITNLSSSSSGP